MNDSVYGAGLDRMRTLAAGVDITLPRFESLVSQLRSDIDGFAAEMGVGVWSLPPVISRSVIERAGYDRAFPQLIGTIHTLRGSGEYEVSQTASGGGAPWFSRNLVSDLVLLPACCYHVYPTIADQSLRGPAKFAVHGVCFRDEETSELGRFRSFRMSELVFVGSPSDSLEWRNYWLDRAQEWLFGLSVSTRRVVADDPFFGRGSSLLRKSQREQQLKWELLEDSPHRAGQALVSANLHLDHLATAFQFEVDANLTNSSCVAFGLDRIAVALLSR